MWADYEDVRWRSTRWMDSAVDFRNASRGYNIDFSGIPIEYEVAHVKSFIFLYPDEPVQRRPPVAYRRYRPWVCSTITACKAHEDSFRGLTQFSLSGNSKGFCGEGFWGWPRRRGRRIPAVGCNGRANAGHRQRTRRPEGSRGNGPLASLLVGHRPLRVCSLLTRSSRRSWNAKADRHRTVSPKTGPL